MVFIFPVEQMLLLSSLVVVQSNPQFRSNMFHQIRRVTLTERHFCRLKSQDTDEMTPLQFPYLKIQQYSSFILT